MSVALSKLGDEANIIMGQSPSGESYNQDGKGAPLLNGPTEFGPAHPVEKQWTTSPTKFCQAGDVLFCVRGATAGRLNVADKEYCIGRGLAAIRGKAGKFDSGFVRYVLANGYTTFQSRGVGSTFINISGDELAKFPVPALPLAEQRRIAEVLDRAEALRAKRRAALAQLDSLTQSLFLDLFGDPATNPKGWPKTTLKDCTEKIQIGPFGSLLHQEDYVADGIPLVNPKHIQDGAIATNPWESVTPLKYDQLEGYHLRQGDVVMGRRGEMGRCAIVFGDEPLLCGTGSLIIRPDNKRTIALFVWAILSTEQMKQAFERLSLGQTLPNLNSGIVEQFTLPLPPISLQREFARRVTVVEAMKTAHRASLAELDALFATLQHRAFRGEL